MGFSSMSMPNFKPIRRIEIVLWVCQAIGAAICAWIVPHGLLLLRVFLGGCLAGPVGFVLGLAWQLTEPTRRKNTPVRLTVVLGLFVLFMAIYGPLFAGPSLRTASRIHALQTTQPSEIQRISVFDKNGQRKFAEFDSPQAITEFLTGCHDAQEVWLSERVFTSSWLVKLEGANPRQLECHMSNRELNVVVCDFVEGDGDAKKYYRSFRSRGLYEWSGKYISKIRSNQWE